jgi:signal transduction histidine kinase/HAMP domain-containing protein
MTENVQNFEPPNIRVRIGTVLNTYSILLAVLPTVVVILIATQLFGAQARDQAVNQMTSIAESRAQEIQRWLENGEIRLNVVLANNEQVRDMRAIVDNPLPNPSLNNNVRVFLRNQLSVQASFESLYLYDLDGEVRLSTVGDDPLVSDVSDQPYFENSLTAAHVEPPYFNEATGEIELVVTGPIFRTDDSDDVIGVLAGRLSLEDLADITEAGTGLGDTGETYLVNENGLLVTASRFDETAVGDQIASEGITSGLRGETGDDTYINYRGENVIGVYRPIPTLDTVLLAEIEQSEALAAINDVQTASIIIAGIAALIAFLIGRGVTSWILRPIQRLTTVARAVMRGDYSQRAGLNMITEIGQLGRAFDTMTTNLVSTIGERNERIEQIEQLSATLETRVADRTRDLRAAADVSKQITTVLDIDRLLQEVAKLTVRSFDLYRCYVYRANEADQVLTFTAGADADGGIIEMDALLPIDATSAAGQAALTQDSHITNLDAPGHLKYLGEETDDSAKSLMAIPMVLGGNLLGVFEVHALVPDYFSTDSRSVLNTLAEQTAIAMRNAELYAEAEASRQEAEEANRVKSQFLANMSHELRTPLNAILNFAEFMADGDLGPVNDEQVDALNKVVNSGEHLLALINDVLDITKIEVGMLELFMEEVDINLSVKSVISTGKGLVRDRPVNLITEIDPDLPVIQGDKRRLHQVFLNLLSNAVKFTPEGDVKFTARQAGEEVHISVSDTGVGIAPDEQDSVFESFRQAEHGRSSGGGTGLGLPISKHFVEAHGGRIWLESELGVGSTFHVTLPMKKTAEPEGASD